jgi:hypothetical protein
MSDYGAGHFLFHAIKWIVLPLLGWLGYQLKRRASKSWAITTGTAETAAVRQDNGSWLPKCWIVDTSYSYRVNSEWYSGFACDRFYEESEADAKARETKGRQLHIRYNPKAPDQSIPV